jgi:hypothetical protein
MRVVDGEEKLKEIYGAWPSFHDAEVWSLTYQRTAEGFSVIMVIHTFQMTSEIDDTGYYVLKNHARVRIRFAGCSRASLDGFNHQNVLFGIEISDRDPAGPNPPFQVRFDSSYGLAGSLQCESIVVEEERWKPPFGVYAEQSGVGDAAGGRSRQACSRSTRRA